MYEDKRFLTAREILEKDFKIDARGYRPQEVDQFLDDIIDDYERFLEIVNNLDVPIKITEKENGHSFVIYNNPNVKSFPFVWENPSKYKDELTFEVYDKKGKLIIAVSSSWALIDKNTRKVVLKPESMVKIKGEKDKNDLEKARVSGISEIRLLSLDLIFSISYLGIIEPLYNIFSEGGKKPLR